MTMFQPKSWVLLFIVIIITVGFGQPDFPSIYSFVTNESLRLPISDVHYLSIRQRSLGTPLYPISRDTLTDLFRNPAFVNYLRGSLLLIDFQNPSPGQSNPANGQLLEFSNRLSHLTFGFWGEKMPFINRPAGIFLNVHPGRENSLENKQDSDPSFFLKSYDQSDILQTELNMQLWVGILQKPGKKMGLSYTFYVNKKNEESEDRDLRSATLPNSIINEQFLHGQDNLNPEHTMHQLSLGAVLQVQNWQLEPAFSFRYSQLKKPRTFVSRGKNITRTGEPPMNTSLENIWITQVLQHFDYNTIAISGNLNATYKNWISYTAVTVGRIDYKEDDKEMNSRQIFTDDTLTTHDSSFVSNQFNETASWFISTYVTIGRQYSISPSLKLFSLLGGYFYHHYLNGEHKRLKEYYSGVNQDLIDTSVSLTDKKYRFTRIQFFLPVGIEKQWRRLQLRGGILWSYTRTSTRKVSDFELSSDSQTSTESKISRSEFIGAGLRWRKFQLDISAQTSLWQVDQWSVGLIYHF